MPSPPQDWTQPLVWLVAWIFMAGTIVAVFVADRRAPAYALGSELVYRVEIGGVAVAVLLFLVTTLRLASFGRTFTSFGAGPVTTAADDPAISMSAAVHDVEEIGVQVAAIAAEVADLAERLAALEQRSSPPS
jgi:hypothetical protein